MVPMSELHCYRLYVQDAVDQFTPSLMASLAESIERELEKNPYYRHAIRMGQLERLEIVPLACSGESAWAAYERACLARGQKLGDIKPAVLHDGYDWPENFVALVDQGREQEARSL